MAVRAWGRRPLPVPALLMLAVLAAGSVWLADAVSRPLPAPHAERAVRLMADGTRVIAAARQAAGGFAPDDVNRTGLVGPADSLITSSVGVLVAKRTATNPAWAGVVTLQLSALGVRSGDVVAAGFSGSFPALNLAVVSAARAIDARLLIITAVSASNYGASDPDFTWLDMEDALRRAGWPVRSLAASIGGVRDAGVDLPPDGPQLVAAAVARSGLPLVATSSLAASVQRRLAIYDAAAGGAPIRVFVSVGGAQANLGACEEPFLVRPGIVRRLPPCPAGLEGVAHHMLRRGIPVLSLLNVRALAAQYGLPVDPVPLPDARTAMGLPLRTYRPGVLLILLVAASVLLNRITP